MHFKFLIMNSIVVQIMFISKVKDEVREIVNVLHLFKTFFSSLNLKSTMMLREKCIYVSN